MTEAATQKTPLHALHVELGARMGPFAGYDMPIQYPSGVLAEHLHTRKRGGSVRRLAYGAGAARGRGSRKPSPRFSRRSFPPTFSTCRPAGSATHNSSTTNGGIVDDLMVTRPPGADGVLRLVVNAARKDVDFALVRERLPAGVRLTPLDEAALIALQGPLAAATLARLAAEEGLDALPS